MNLFSRIKNTFRRQPRQVPSATTKTTAENAKGAYISDAPVEDPEEDRFDRRAFADRIAETIGAKLDPTCIVVGVYGPWGDGKTSVLNFVAKSLQRFDSVICFKFNPWRFEDESVLLRTYFESLAQACHRRLSKRKEDIGKALDRYGRVLASGLKAVQSTVENTGIPLESAPVGEMPEEHCFSVHLSLGLLLQLPPQRVCTSAGMVQAKSRPASTTVLMRSRAKRLIKRRHRGQQLIRPFRALVL